MYPPAAITTREAIDDLQFQGATYPKQSVFLIPIWAIHHDPKYVPNQLPLLNVAFLSTKALSIRGSFNPFCHCQKQLLPEENAFFRCPYSINLPTRLLMVFCRSWPNPEQFNPDRWLPENKSKIIPGSYLPFGLGPRMCIGYKFSLCETKVVLAML